MTKRSNRTRGTRRVNMGADLKARSIQSFAGRPKPMGQGTALPLYYFDGISMYATHSSWDTLGNFAVYGAITFEVRGDRDDVVVDEPPVVEFGRVGIDYHTGFIRNVKYTDDSPIQDTDVKESSVGTLGPFDMSAGSVSFVFILDATQGAIIVGYLSSAAFKFVLDPNATNLIVDGSPYANEDLNVGQHYAVSFDTTGGTLINVNSNAGMQNLEIQT
jgi:hypothetical protein